MLLGVAKEELGDTFAEVLRLLGVERALVVCGKEGLDEISIAGETWVSISFSTVAIELTSRPGGWRMARSQRARYTRLKTLVSPPTP